MTTVKIRNWPLDHRCRSDVVQHDDHAMMGVVCLGLGVGGGPFKMHARGSD